MLAFKLVLPFLALTHCLHDIPCNSLEVLNAQGVAWVWSESRMSARMWHSAVYAPVGCQDGSFRGHYRPHKVMHQPSGQVSLSSGSKAVAVRDGKGLTPKLLVAHCFTVVCSISPDTEVMHNSSHHRRA
jgi:hypothetical protein